MTCVLLDTNPSMSPMFTYSTLSFWLAICRNTITLTSARRQSHSGSTQYHSVKPYSSFGNRPSSSVTMTERVARSATAPGIRTSARFRKSS